MSTNDGGDYGIWLPDGTPVEGWQARVKKWRKRPLVIEGFGPVDRRMVIGTPQGARIAEPGDYVVSRGTANEMYPVKPWVFEFVYEQAPDDAPVDLSETVPDDRR